MKPVFFTIIYDNKSKHLADFVAEKYHFTHNIKYLDETHPKEKKEAIRYKTIAGTSHCPYLGVYDDSDGIVDALWGETTEINQETITNFFKKYARTINYKVIC